MMQLTEFNALLGQNSYVRCHGKERQDPDIVNVDAAEAHLFSGGTIGWWVREGFIVVDIDEHADKALEMIKALKIKTLCCKTPRGVHLYFKTETSIPQKIKMMLPIGLKCDVRVANKGYVMLPYGMTDRAFSRNKNIADLPRILTPMVGVTRETMVGMADGDGRNDALFRQLMDFKNRGASQTEIEAAAGVINNIAFGQPMPDSELGKILKSVERYEAKNAGENPYIIYNKGGFPIQINSRAVCDYFVNRGDVFVMGSESFQYRDGRYQEAGSNIRNTIKEMLGDADNLITQDRIMSTYKLLCDDVRIHRSDDQLNTEKNLVNMQNGMFDYNKKELLPHDSKFLSTLQIPHDWKKPKPLNKTLLCDFLNKTGIEEEDREMLLDFMAYCLVLDNGLKTFMILAGQSNTGKSVLIRFIERMIGLQNVSNLSMHELNERFYPALLKDKLLNSCADNSSLPLQSIESLKKITGGDQIMHEKKGQEPFFFTPFSKLIFSFNQLPLQLEEKSNAFYKRMRILQLNKELFLTQDYVDALIDSAGETVPTLLTRLPVKEIRSTANSERLVEGLRRDSDSVHAFLATCTKPSPDTYITKTNMYSAYQRFCINGGREAHRKQQFMRHLKASGVVEARHPDTREAAWKGLKVKKI